MNAESGIALFGFFLTTLLTVLGFLLVRLIRGIDAKLDQFTERDTQFAAALAEMRIQAAIKDKEFAIQITELRMRLTQLEHDFGGTG